MNETILFGTDGWRGLIDVDVNENSVAEAAQAFAVYLKSIKESDILTAIGYDGRKNSRLYAEIFSEVLSGNGISVYLTDKIIPVPVLSYFTKFSNLDSGVMITASHNPAEYNGIKFKAAYGGPYLTENTLRVEQFLHKYPVKKSREKILIQDFIAPYLEHINKLINFSNIKDSRIRILIDSMSGAGQNIIENILSDHNIYSETIFSAPEENFSGRQPEPIEKNLLPLSEKLKSADFSLGIATDGDADRLGVLMETGEWLSAQETILLLADYICKNDSFQGDIVKTSSVTDKLRLFGNDERKVLDVQVGFKYICEEMLKKKVAFGCEESGGFGYGLHLPERDGILSGLLLCEALASSGFPKISNLAESLRKKYGEIFYHRKDIPYKNSDRLSLLPNLFRNPAAAIGGFNVSRIGEFLSSRGIINGLKYYLEGNSNWLLIRASETEPLIRIYAESENSPDAIAILNDGFRMIVK